MQEDGTFCRFQTRPSPKRSYFKNMVLGLGAFLIVFKEVLSVQVYTSDEYDLPTYFDSKEKTLFDTYIFKFPKILLSENTCEPHITRESFVGVADWTNDKKDMYIPSISLNKSYNSSVPIFSSGGSSKTLHYRVSKISSTTAYESAVQFNLTSGKTWVDYKEYSLDNPGLKPGVWGLQTNYTRVADLVLDPSAKVTYEIYFKDVDPAEQEAQAGSSSPNHVVKVYFGVGFFNRTTETCFKTVFLTDIIINGTKLDTATNSTRKKTPQEIMADKANWLYKLRFIPVSVYGDTAQFIFFRKRFTKATVITAQGGVSKNAKITLDSVEMPFPIVKISYCENQFLIVEKSDYLKEQKRKVYKSFYLKFLYGTNLKASILPNLIPISEGVLVSFYNTLDTNFIMADFLMPYSISGENSQKASAVSTFYYSDPLGVFNPFIEQLVINKELRMDQTKFYYRVNLAETTLEFFNVVDSENKTCTDFIVMAGTNRFTGTDLGLKRISTKLRIASVHEFKTEGFVLIKFKVDEKEASSANHTLLINVAEPKIFFQLKPREARMLQEDFEDSGRKLSSRMLQKWESPINFIKLELRCSRDMNNTNQPQSTSTMGDIRLKIYNLTNNLLDFRRSNPMAEPTKGKKQFEPFQSHLEWKDILPSGFDSSQKISKFLSGSFIEAVVDEPLSGKKFLRGANTHSSNNYLKLNVSSLDIHLPILSISYSLGDRVTFQAKRKKNAQNQSTISHYLKGIFGDENEEKSLPSSGSTGFSTSSSILILDSAKKTSMYSSGPNSPGLTFQKYSIDSRHISEARHLAPGELYLNISKNYIALNLKTLRERPLTSLSTYCIDFEKIKPSFMDEILLCMTKDSFEAHYFEQRHQASQANLKIDLSDLQSLTQSQVFLSMSYSVSFPSHIFVLTHSKENRFVRTYSLHCFELFLAGNLKMERVGGYVLEEFTKEARKNSKIEHTTMIDSNFLVATNSSKIFQYYIINQFSFKSKLLVRFLKMYDIGWHYRPYVLPKKDGSRDQPVELDVHIKGFQEINIYDKNEKSFESQAKRIRRLAMLLEIKNKYYQKTYYTVAVLNHELSTYNAFEVVAGTNMCKLVTMGPAFISNSERLEKTAVIGCVEGSPGDKVDPSQPAELKMFVLETANNFIYMKEYSNVSEIATLETTEETKRKFSGKKKFNIGLFKSVYMLDLMEYEKDNSLFDKSVIDRIFLHTEITMTFAEPFALLKVKQLNNKLKELELDPNDKTWIVSPFRRITHTKIEKRIQDYFDGNLFQTEIKCQSFIECRDKIIDGRGQLQEKKKLANFKSEMQSPMFQTGVAFDSINHSQVVYFSSSYKIHSNLNNKTVSVEVEELLGNCSAPVTYQDTLVYFCHHELKLNYLFFMNLFDSMSYFTISLDRSLFNGRTLLAHEARLQLRETFLTITTFNLFRAKYLVAYLFKLTQQAEAYQQGASASRLFANPLQRTLGVVFLAETYVNEDNMELQVFHNSSQGPLNDTQDHSEKVYIYSVKRSHEDTLKIVFDGYKIDTKVDKGKFNYTFELICESAFLNLKFKKFASQNSPYLLDNAVVKPLTYDRGDTMDLVTHLPNSQDYLLRIKFSHLETGTLRKELNMTTDVAYLTISNPFFGVRPLGLTKTLFANDTYIVVSNYHPKTCYIRAYYLDADIKEKVKQPSTIKLFNLIDKELEDKRMNIEEKDLNTAYSYSIVGFKQLVRDINFKDLSIKNGDFKYKLSNHGNL